MDDNLINDGVWDRGLVDTIGAEWIEQKIPKGQHIVGFKCSPVYDLKLITHLSFLLADTELGTMVIENQVNYI